MSHVRCRNCSLIIEAAPRPPGWRCPNCLALNPSPFASGGRPRSPARLPHRRRAGRPGD